MIDQYGCDEKDFICKVKARQAIENRPAPIVPIAPTGQGVNNSNPQPIHTPQTQDQRDFNLADTVAQNQQARNAWNGQSNNELIGNAMGIPLSMANVMAGGTPVLLGTTARGVGNFAQGINPYDTTKTIDPEGKGYGWYKGDTNSQGNPTGPSGSFERGLQGTYGNQYEKDIVSMFGEGSPEHFKSLEVQHPNSEFFGILNPQELGELQANNVVTTQPQGGWLNGVVEGLLGAIGVDTSGGDNSSDDDSPKGNNNGGGGSSGGNSGFHGSDHNWN